MTDKIKIDANKAEAAFGYPPRMFVSNIDELADDLERIQHDPTINTIDNAPSYILNVVHDGVELRNAQGLEPIRWRDIQPIIEHIRANK